MNLEKALELFSIDDITTETAESIKKKYKKLMIKYHPDNYRGSTDKVIEIGLALELIRKTLKEIELYNLLNSKPEMLNILLTIDRLIDIYHGKKVIMHRKSDSGETIKFEVDNKIIQKNNTLIIVNAEITHNGQKRIETSVKRWSINDSYELSIDIPVDKLDKSEKINIKLANFEKEFNIIGTSVLIPLTLEYNIKINISINKKLKQLDNQGG